MSNSIPDYPSSTATSDECERYCEVCGYNLIGLAGSIRCPECGTEFDPDVIPPANIPWLKRQRIGYVRAFFGTLFEVLISPRKFATEIRNSQRVQLESAKQFKVACIRLSAILSASLAGSLLLLSGARGSEIVFGFIVVFTLAAVSVWVFLSIVINAEIITRDTTAAETLRLECLAQYAAAPAVPLALLPALILLFAGFAQPIACFIALFSFPAAMWSLRLVFLRIAVNATGFEIIISFGVLVIIWFIALMMTIMTGVAVTLILTGFSPLFS